MKTLDEILKEANNEVLLHAIGQGLPQGGWQKLTIEDVFPALVARGKGKIAQAKQRLRAKEWEEQNPESATDF